MEISDLVKIGSLEFSKNNPSGISIKVKTEFQNLLSKLNKVFLIFKDHRVRYVTVKCVETTDDKKSYIQFTDSEIEDEIKSVNTVYVSLDKDEIESLDDSGEYFDPVGMKVVWREKEVAIIKDFFFNGAHDVYEIQMFDSDKLVLIPDVEAFVTETNIDGNFIRVIDLDQFLEI